MVSNDFKKLTNLVYNQHFKIKSINDEIQKIFPSGDYHDQVTIVLEKDNNEIQIISTEDDLIKYSFSLHKTVNNEGNFEFMSYKDLNKYWEDIDFLIERDNTKIKNAFQSLIDGKFQFSYNPEKLLENFLKSKNKTSKKFERLKLDYFEIRAYFGIESKRFLDIHQKNKKKNPNYQKYCDLLDNILMHAFRRDQNPLKNFKNYCECIEFDLEDLLSQAKDETYYKHDLLKMLAERGSVDGEIGIKYLLDIYRRLAEILSHFVNSIRIAIEIIDGIEQPKSKKKYIENYRIIQSHPNYSFLVSSLDPRIRHSESHINTIIDKKAGKVVLTEKRNGKRTIIREYTFEEISHMTDELEKGLFLAVLSSFCMHKIVLIDMILMSEQYKIQLLGIGNKR